MKLIAAVLFAAAALAAANPAGRWNLTAQTPAGKEYKLGLTLKNDGGKWTGEMDSERGSVPLSELQVTDTSISYKIDVGDAAYTIKLELTGDSAKGTFAGSNGANGPVNGSREGAAAPATSFAGEWKGTAKTSKGKQYNVRLTLRETEGKWTGNLATDEGEVGLANIKAEKTDLTFDIPLDDGTYQVKMSMAGTSAKGTFSGPGDVTGTLDVSR